MLSNFFQLLSPLYKLLDSLSIFSSTKNLVTRDSCTICIHRVMIIVNASCIDSSSGNHIDVENLRFSKLPVLKNAKNYSVQLLFFTLR